MNYELGTVRVHTEIDDDARKEISCLSDVSAKYSELGEKQKEHFYAIYLTKGNEEIGDKLIGLGGLNSVQVDIIDVVRTAILVKAGAVILVHNHPSGNPEPTQQDIEATKEIKEALNHLSITLLDHVIITHKNSHSMKEHGELKLGT